jgi:CubicO group peptidase (beta-lactamase class C family)
MPQIYGRARPLVRARHTTTVVFFGLSALLVAAPALRAQSADQAAFKRAADYSELERGDAVLVMVNGRVVFEQYPRNASANRTHVLMSGTKSFAGVLAIAAQADGLLTLDEPVAQTITEWQSDPARARVTIRELLTLTSGINAGSHLNPPSYAAAVTAPFSAAPGAKFQYGAEPFQIFGELLKRKLAPRGETVQDYLKKRILDPLTIRTGFWRGAQQGEPQLPSGAYLTAREWAKFGEFVRNRGLHGGQQLIPAALFDELARGTSANPAYGLTWWLNADVPAAQRESIRQLQNNFGGMDRVPGLEGMITAAGAFKQRLYIIPSRRMVVVRFGNSVGPQFDDARFLGLLLGAIRE